MIKIAISGPHGSGKTFTAFEKVNELKLLYPNVSVGVIQEVARMCPLPINKDSTDESELWIFTEQLSLEMAYSKIYKILVCDRSIVDTIAYARVRGHKYTSGMISIASEFITSYDKIIFKTTSNNDYQIDDKTRDMDANFRLEVEKEMISIYESFLRGGIKFNIEYV